jgi:hypothetical protein
LIRNLAILAAVLWSAVATAQSTTEPADDVLSPYRATFDDLSNQAIGTVSQPVAFSWRRTRLHVAGTAAYPLEFNTFANLRGGVLLRRPVGGMLLELGVSRAVSWDTKASRQLALTPYRQAGRPSRMELDIGVAVPIAEGVVTTQVRALPALQLTFNLYSSVRYLWYPGAQQGMTAGQAAGALFSPTLSSREIDNLDDNRLSSMQVDPGRYGLMLGFGNDLYFAQGLFVSPRIQMAIPVLAPVSKTSLPVWVDLSMHAGWAF